MKTQILLLALVSLSVSLTASTQCACSELTVQADCTANGCVWATVNSVSSCGAMTVSCTATTQSDCDAVTGCAWTNAGACAAFTKCSDYTVSTAGMCSQKDATCSDGTASGSSIPCQTTPSITCSTFTTQATCRGKQSDRKVCYYQNNACAAYDMSSCSVITIADLCNMTPCNQSGTACAASTCASITDTTKCTYVVNNDLASVSICGVSGTTCGDANDTSALTQANFNSNTYNTYEWNGSSCAACTGGSSNKIHISSVTIGTKINTTSTDATDTGVFNKFLANDSYVYIWKDNSCFACK